MQGWICDPQSIDGTWLVGFPQCDEKGGIAILAIAEEDLRLLPGGIDVRTNEAIKAQSEDPI